MPFFFLLDDMAASEVKKPKLVVRQPSQQDMLQKILDNQQALVERMEQLDDRQQRLPEGRGEQVPREPASPKVEDVRVPGKCILNIYTHFPTWFGGARKATVLLSTRRLKGVVFGAGVKFRGLTQWGEGVNAVLKYSSLLFFQRIRHLISVKLAENVFRERIISKPTLERDTPKKYHPKDDLIFFFSDVCRPHSHAGRRRAVLSYSVNADQGEYAIQRARNALRSVLHTHRRNPPPSHRRAYAQIRTSDSSVERRINAE